MPLDLLNPSVQMIDITAPQDVEIVIRHDASVIWVNVDGACVLRICRIPVLRLDNQADPLHGGQIHPRIEDPIFRRGISEGEFEE